MRKNILLLLALSFMLITCTQTEEGPRQNDVVGTWVRESIVASMIEADCEDAASYIRLHIGTSNNSMADSYIFTPNGRVLYIDSTYTEEGMYHLIDTSILFRHSTGENVTIPVGFRSNKLSLYSDETSYYQDWVKELFPNKDIVVSKVITRYKYKKVDMIP